MKRISLLLILLLSFYIVNAQKEGNIWYFGDNAGLDFNSGSPVVLTNGAMQTNEGCSSVSDSAGSLLFYTDGSKVWNSNHVLMLNGTGLTGNSTSSQSAIIIKQPATQNIYYIFSLYTDYCYSVVDMTLNGGLGDVTAAKNVVIMNNASTEKQCATHHSNSTDVWMLLHKANSFYAYQLTVSGFNPVPVQSTIGLSDNVKVGQMKFSHQGNKIVFGIAASAGVPNICLLDFDNSTGVVSNNIDIPNGVNQSYGVEFSPDGSKLYATGNPSSIKAIYQYDLNAGSPSAIIASQILIGTTPQSDITGLQTGPDGKIYVCLTSSNFLSVINDPDSLGLACNYSDAAINLGTGTCQLGLPELISDYYHYSPLGLNNPESNNHLSIFPNPVNDVLNVETNSNELSEVFLYDIASRKLLQQTFTNSITLNTAQLAKGIYLYEVRPVPILSGNKDGVVNKGKIIKD